MLNRIFSTGAALGVIWPISRMGIQVKGENRPEHRHRAQNSLETAAPSASRPWPLRPSLFMLISTEDESAWFHFQMTEDKGPFSRKCICPAVYHLSASGSHQDKRCTGLSVLCFGMEPSRMDFSFDSVPENFTDQPVPRVVVARFHGVPGVRVFTQDCCYFGWVVGWCWKPL